MKPNIMQAAAGIFAADDDADVDLCDVYKEVTGLEFDDTDQNPNGTCVTHGNKKAADLSVAFERGAGGRAAGGRAVECVAGGGAKWRGGWARCV